MKNIQLKYILSFGFITIILACSTKKDNYVNRKWHSVNTKYNVLYNGDVAMQKGIEDVKATYSDNFWEVLPLERMQITEDEQKPGDTKNANFERAETKATKAIQKHSMNIGGFEKPLFVIGTDTDKNLIYMGMGEDHPGLYRRCLFISPADEHWVRSDLKLEEGESRKYSARIRYRQPLESCTLHKKEEGLYILFDRPQRSITPGQFAAWYEGDELIGSGVIN